MPGSKKRKVASDLPDPLELLAKSKAAKRSVKTAFDALLSLDLLQCANGLLQKLSEDEKLAWLIAKFGWNAVSSVGECIRSFPTSLTESQRGSLFAKFHPDISTYQQISSFLVDHCSTFISMSTNTIVEILAPQTRVCFECGSSLASYHTCEAELYTLSGVRSATKVTLRCQPCKLLYNYSQFGNKSNLGFRYYPQMQPIVEVTDQTFVERKLLEFQCNLA